MSARFPRCFYEVGRCELDAQMSSAAFFYIIQPALEGRRRKIANPSVSFGGYRSSPCIA